MPSIEIPEVILSNDKALAAWHDMIGQVAPAGFLQPTRRNALIRYCLVWAQYQDCMASIDQHGPRMPVKDSDGNVVSYRDRPEVGRALKLSAECTRLEASLGTFVSRKGAASRQADLESWRKDFRKNKASEK